MTKESSSSSPGDTAPLVRRWKAEGNEALGPLYERFHSDLEKCVRRIVGQNPPRGFELNDLVHEVWTAICRKHGKELKLSSPGSFRALLQQIAHDTIISLYRNQKAKRRNEGKGDGSLNTQARREGTPVHGPSRVVTPSRIAVAEEVIERLKASLPKNVFDAWYRVEQGYSPSELEDLLGLSERHIRRLHRQGLQRLGEILGESAG